MTWPTWLTEAGVAVLATLMRGVWVAATDVVEGGEVTVSASGSVAAATAESCTDPWSMSAWVRV